MRKIVLIILVFVSLHAVATHWVVLEWWRRYNEQEHTTTPTDIFIGLLAPVLTFPLNSLPNSWRHSLPESDWVCYAVNSLLWGLALVAAILVARGIRALKRR